MIIKKLTLKNAYKIICLIFFWLSSFLFPEKLTGKIISVKKIKKQNQIDPKFFLTFESLFLADRFGFYFEAILPWDHSITLSLFGLFLTKISSKNCF